MSKIERFEDIQAWQKARDLSKDIYKVTNDEPFTKDLSLKDQIRRASTSIMLILQKGLPDAQLTNSSNFYISLMDPPQKFNLPSILLWIRTIFQITNSKRCINKQVRFQKCLRDL